MMNNRKSRGFTLVELAIVLVIVGVLLGGFIGTLASRIETTRRVEAKQQLEDVKEAILGFAAANGRIPCPALANPAVPAEVGLEQPNGGGVCTSLYGFVPGRTLDLSGAYNRDNLLVDVWGNPIRYSVTNDSNFTTAGGIAGAGMGAAAPNIIVCDSDSANASSCSAGILTLVDNAPFVILSLGKDGNEFVGVTAANSDQGENSGEAVVAANAAGENIAYTVGNNRVFVSKDYSEVGSVSGQFDDLILWSSPYILYSKMIEAGQLP